MTKEITARQKYILHLAHEENGVKMDELVRRLDVSRRTIQRDISALQDFLKDFRVRLKMDSGGVALEGNPPDILRALGNSGKLPKTLALTPKDRSFYVAVELLENDGPLKLSYLGKKLGVTSANLSQQLGQVARWMSGHGLRLIRRRGYGVEVTGPESLRVEAIAELVYEQFSLPDLMAIMRAEPRESNREPAYAWLITWFGDQRINRVRRVLFDELSGMDPPLDEAGFYGFMLHVLLTCMRLEEGIHMEHPQAVESNLASERDMCLRVITRLVPSVQDVEGEVEYLAQHLRGAKVLLTEDSRILPLNITSMDLAYRLTEYLSDELNLPLAKDSNFMLGMAQHLEPAVYRMKTGLNIRNPLLDQIKERYSTFFAAVSNASQAVMGAFDLKVPEAEIGYLTMHLGAALERWKAGNQWRVKIVCPNGISSAELLASRMRNEFPQVRVESVEAVLTLNDTDCDLIVSTVPLENRGRPTITVTPFLDAADRQKIQATLESLSSSVPASHPLGRRLAPAFTDEQRALDAKSAKAMSELAYLKQSFARSVNRLIAEIAQDAVDDYVTRDKREVADVLQAREHLGSIVLPGKRFAVLHARPRHCHRCVIGIYRLGRPVEMQGVNYKPEKVDGVLVLLAPVDAPAGDVKALGRLSAGLVMDENIIETLRTKPILAIKKCIFEAMSQTQE